jgi:membrane protein YqaA with SNARE-associated domain
MGQDVTVSYNGKPVIGFGETITAPVIARASSSSPWAMAITTSVLGAATGWVFDELARSVRKRRR